MNDTIRPGDPSNVQQSFVKYDIQIYCCRYWWLKSWEHNELSFPYWRIYYNGKDGACVTYDNETIPLSPNRIYIIPPNTSYSSQLFDYPIPENGHNLIGARITEDSEFQDMHIINHLFIHFNIRFSHISVSNKIFSFPLTNELHAEIESIINYLRTISAVDFDFKIVVKLNFLISLLLSEISPNEWSSLQRNSSILKSLNYIETHLDNDLSNEKLAHISCMATNSFTRLFKKNVGVSPQRYVQRKRVDTACSLLHHSSYSIDQISSKVGFSNRYHFTRVFSDQTTISPSRYRKDF